MTLDIGSGLVALGIFGVLGWVVGKCIEYHLTLAALDRQQSHAADHEEEDDDDRY